MNAQEYQKQAARTLIDDSQVKPLEARQHRIVWNTIGLMGEVGEVLEHDTGDYALRLVSYASKVAELVKKGIFHEQGINRERLMSALEGVLDCCSALSKFGVAGLRAGTEIGDVLWYTAAIFSCLEEDMGGWAVYSEALGVQMTRNIEKLKKRFPDGWDTAASAAKADEAAL